MGGEGVGQDDLAGGVNFVGLSVVDLVRRHQVQNDMVMGLIIPGEEIPAELSGNSVIPSFLIPRFQCSRLGRQVKRISASAS
jgi:hypothetical protein